MNRNVTSKRETKRPKNGKEKAHTNTTTKDAFSLHRRCLFSHISLALLPLLRTILSVLPSFLFLYAAFISISLTHIHIMVHLSPPSSPSVPSLYHISSLLHPIIYRLSLRLFFHRASAFFSASTYIHLVQTFSFVPLLGVLTGKLEAGEKRRRKRERQKNRQAPVPSTRLTSRVLPLLSNCGWRASAERLAKTTSTK